MIIPERSGRRTSGARRSATRRSDDTPLGLRIGVLGKKWSLLILRHVADAGRTTFTRALRAHPLMSRRMLSLRLQDLQREGYVEKITFDGNPRKTAYALTTKGRDALPLLRALSDFVRQYGDGVAVSEGRTVPVTDVCFGHPEIPRSTLRLDGGPPFPTESVPSSAARIVIYKDRCEKCKGGLTPTSDAYVCSYECTWCRTCAEGFGWRCPNCQLRLQPRPPVVEGR